VVISRIALHLAEFVLRWTDHLLVTPRYRLSMYGRLFFLLPAPTLWKSLPDILYNLSISLD